MYIINILAINYYIFYKNELKRNSTSGRSMDKTVWR